MTSPRSIVVLVGVLSSCFSEPSGDDGGSPAGETTATSVADGASSGSTAVIEDAGTGTADPMTTTSGASTPTTSATADASSTSADSDGGASQSSGTGSVCGDGILDPDEQCDGADLGDVTCAAGQVGPPICTEQCTVDVSPCCLPTGAMCMLVGSNCCSGSCGLDLECN